MSTEVLPNLTDGLIANIAKVYNQCSSSPNGKVQVAELLGVELAAKRSELAARPLQEVQRLTVAHSVLLRQKFKSFMGRWNPDGVFDDLREVASKSDGRMLQAPVYQLTYLPHSDSRRRYILAAAAYTGFSGLSPEASRIGVNFYTQAHPNRHIRPRLMANVHAEVPVPMSIFPKPRYESTAETLMAPVLRCYQQLQVVELTLDALNQFTPPDNTPET